MILSLTVVSVNRELLLCFISIVQHTKFCLTEIFLILMSLTGSAHYSWKNNECLGTTASASTGLYYPDWAGDNEGCLNDGNEPGKYSFSVTRHQSETRINSFSLFHKNIWSKTQTCGCTTHSRHAARRIITGCSLRVWGHPHQPAQLIGTWTFLQTNVSRIVQELLRVEDSPRAGILSTAHKISVARSGCGGILRVARLE